MNDIVFSKGNGGMGRAAANEDPISGLIMLLPNLATTDLDDGSVSFSGVTSGNSTLYIAETPLTYFEQLEQLGLTKQDFTAAQAAADTTAAETAHAKACAINAVVYHVREFFRMSESGTLYLAIKLSGTDITKDDVKALQHYANGKIRQIGIMSKSLTNLAAYQEACTGAVGYQGMEEEHQPLSIAVSYCGNFDTVTASGSTGSYVFTPSTGNGFTAETLTQLKGNTNKVLAGRCNLSVVVSCDLDSDVLTELGGFGHYGAIGLTLGAISKASVHESIGWVQKFPLGLTAPGFITGDLINEVDNAALGLIDGNRYIFIRTHVGDADCYFNDSHTLDVATSDYAYIENVRTIDKATRGIRSNLLPYLNSPLRVDSTTGKLDRSVVAFLQTTAGKALEDMEKAGELSGYSCEIDPDQNVLSTSQVEVVIQHVGIGVMRKVNVKIGYTTSL